MPCATLRDREPDGPRQGRPGRAGGVQVGGRPQAVPARGVREGRSVGSRRVRRGRAAGRARCRRPRTAAWRCTATRPARPGAPTVLLYSHYDVQPPLGEDAWTSPVWELTERDGRWYGRGAADCKGNIVMHLTALRALSQVDGGFPCGVKIICEGSEEQGPAGWRRSCRRTPTCCAPTRSSSSTRATSPSGSRPSPPRCAA